MTRIRADIFERGSTFDGTRHVRASGLTCVVCGTKETIKSQSTMRPPAEALLRHRFIALGWSFKGVHAYCPEHNGLNRPHLRVVPPAPAPTQEKEMPPITAKPEPVRELAALGTATVAGMPLATRRKINRLIGDNWDEKLERYLGNMSDEMIARQCQCPRAWVAEVRVENYGESGENEDMDAVRAEIEALSARVKTAFDDAIKIADVFDTVSKDLKALRTRMERVEATATPRR